MFFAADKTFALLILIGIGFALRRKLHSPDHLQTLKLLILNLALPAVVFIALMNLEVSAELAYLPLVVIAFNAVMMLVFRIILPFLDIGTDSKEMRTYLLLLPSLAPGLSCFPLIVEYLGNDALAWAAMADVGNKISVLFLSYLFAMHWYHRLNESINPNKAEKLKLLILGMISEPINLVMIAAFILLGFGISYLDLPASLKNVSDNLGGLMVPLIMLFIGLSAKLNWNDLKSLFSILFIRSGIAFCFSAIALSALPNLSLEAKMLLIVLPQSACSFWPFAHMSMIEVMEHKRSISSERKVFNLRMATNMLALSLPFSIFTILAVFNSGNVLTDVSNLALAGLSFIGIALFVLIFGRRSLVRKLGLVREGR